VLAWQYSSDNGCQSEKFPARVFQNRGIGFLSKNSFRSDVSVEGYLRAGIMKCSPLEHLLGATATSVDVEVRDAGKWT
jgi:hypothetical protein